MRMLVLAALAITAFAATMTIDRTAANAVVGPGRAPRRLRGSERCCSCASSLPL